MKKFAHFLFGGLGLLLLIFAFFLRNGSPDADVVITNLASTFMMFAGAVCLLVGVVTFFRRHDHEEW